MLRYAAFLLLFLAACGGGGYDVANDCTQVLACCAELGSSSGSAQQSICEQNSQAVYDAANDATKQAIEDAYAACATETGCDYVECVSGARICPF